MARRRRRTIGREARANALFVIFYGIGGERTLRAVREQVLSMGGRPPGLSTLEKYSRDFAWQDRAAELDQRAVERLAEHMTEDIAAIQFRHGGHGRAVQELAREQLDRGLEEYDHVDPVRATGMLLDGIKIELLASGQATDRQEIAIVVVDVMVRAIAALFNEVNQIEDRNARAEAFVQGADKIVREHFQDAAGALTA